jgi:precorrin isomerase
VSTPENVVAAAGAPDAPVGRGVVSEASENLRNVSRPAIASMGRLSGTDGAVALATNCVPRKE